MRSDDQKRKADAPSAYDGPITLTPDGGPFLYNDAVPYEMLLAAGVIIPSWLVVYAVISPRVCPIENARWGVNRLVLSLSVGANKAGIPHTDRVDSPLWLRSR